MSQDVQTPATQATPGPDSGATSALTPKRRWKRIVFLFALVLLVGGAFAGYRIYFWYQNDELYHPGTVQAGVLYRDGNRGLREFQHALAADKVRTVFSLVDDDEMNDPKKPQFVDESNYCSARLIQYIRIPVKLGGWPTTEDIRRFIKYASDPTNQPALVHCAQGIRRTGMFVAAYQMSVLHESKDQAISEIKTFGHKDQDLDDVRTFIREYDPITQTIPTKNRGTASE